MTGLTRGLAVDLGKESITCNCVCPGPIRTAMTNKNKAIYAKRRTALRRYGKPEKVAHMKLSLVFLMVFYATVRAILVHSGLILRNG